MTSKIVVNNIQTDAGISSVTLLSHIAGHDSTQNISGINSVTANAFYGDGSNLTGVSGVTINSNAANRIITGSGSANTLEGNSNFTYTGSVVTHNNPSGLAKLDVKGSVGGGALGASISVRNTNSANNGSGEFQFQDPGSNIFAKIAGTNLTDGSNNGYMTFHTSSATSGLVERARIDDQGNFKFNSGYGSAATAFGVRAWVSFNGTGTPAIRSDGGVSSVGDNDTGDYTVNFDNNMPDVNYAVGGLSENWEGTNSDSYTQISGYTGGAVVGSYRFVTLRSRFDQQPPQKQDPPFVQLIFVR